MRTTRFWLVLASLFIISTSAVVYSLATKSVPLRIYVSFSTLTGAVLAIAVLSLPKGPSKKTWIFPLLLLATLGLILWSFHAIATNYRLIAFEDSFRELVHLKLILSEGHVYIGADRPELGVGPGFSPSYPVFAVFAASFAQITGLEALTVGILLPLVSAFLLFFSTVLFLRRLLADSKIRNLAISLGILAFVISPDMIFSSTQFYHRGLSLGFVFLLLYFLLRYSVDELRGTYKLVLVVLLLLIPLTHSVYPSVYVVFMWSFLTLTMFVRALGRHPKVGISNRIRPMVFPAIIILTAHILWNFVLAFPTPVSDFSGNYVRALLNPRWEIGDIARFQLEALPTISEVLRPEPWTLLLPLRDVLLVAPLLIVGATLLYKFVKNDVRSRTGLFALIAMLSFVPIIIAEYASGGYPLRFRYYAFPLIAYSMGLFYASLMNWRKVTKVIALAVVTFLVSMAFLSPFWHIYFPRQLYDPEVEWGDVGFPNPTYIHFGEFAEDHPLGDGLILTDFKGQLVATLTLEELKRVRELGEHYGEPKTYIIEFVGLKGALGYQQPETVETMDRIRASIDHEYSKIVDAGAYSVFFRP